MKLCSCLIAAILVLFAGCAEEDALSDSKILSYNFDFSQSDHGWSYGFADYPAGEDDSAFFELRVAYTSLPSSLAAQNAVMISGNNHSDDLFMYIKKKIDGLEPNTNYTLTYVVEFASDAKQGMVGIGGAPGESVFLKVGATGIEPKSIVEFSQHRINIDKGNQAEDGQDMVQIGNISVPETSEGYAITSRSNVAYNSNASYNKPIVVQSNSNGEVWLVVGTDSGYEGITTLYYTKVSAVLSK